MRCFVPGCKSASNKPKNKERNKEKRSFFIAPKAKETFEAWRKAIGREDRVFKKSNLVCDLHFQPEDIVTEFVHHMPDGNIIRFKRDKIRLKKGAVPRILPKKDPLQISPKKTTVPESYVNVLTLTDEMKKQLQENIKLNKSTSPTIFPERDPLTLPDEKKKQLKENSFQMVPEPTSLVYFNFPSKNLKEIPSPPSRQTSQKSSLQYVSQSSSQLNNNALQNIVNPSTLPRKMKIVLNENNSKKIPELPLKLYANNYSQYFTEISKPFSSSISENSSSQDSFQTCTQVFLSSPSDLKRRLYLKICEKFKTNRLSVLLPLGLWVSNHISTDKLECIMWCLWNDDASGILKRITIFGDMTLKIYINEKPVSIPEIEDVQTIEDVARLLSDVSENIIPCSRVDGRKSSKNCPGYVRRNKTSERCAH